VLTSPDAQTWTRRFSRTAANLFDVAYGGGYFVAAGGDKSRRPYSGTFVSSEDGVHWKPIQLMNDFGEAWESIAFGKGMFVAAGGNGFVGRIKLSEGPFPEPYFNGGGFTLASGNAPGVAFGDGTFVAATEFGGLYTSPNGESWSQARLPAKVHYGGAAYANGTFLGVGDKGVIVQLGDPPPVRPQIRQQPSVQTVAIGETAIFTVFALGSAPLAYQWFKDGVALPSETKAELFIKGVEPAAAGTYQVRVSNFLGEATSEPAALTGVVRPSIDVVPLSKTATLGETVEFNATATGAPPLRYEWFLNGNLLANATTGRLVLFERSTDRCRYIRSCRSRCVRHERQCSNTLGSRQRAATAFGFSYGHSDVTGSFRECAGDGTCQWRAATDVSMAVQWS